MPAKHVIKQYDAPAFYHVYNRASGERSLFRDNNDRVYFLALLKRHLLENKKPGNHIKLYDVELIAYCLMGTHFHLLLYQPLNATSIEGYMRSIGTGYSMYYNKRYKSKGHVFQSSYRASHITEESYLAHITRYIHLNPRRYQSWPWSSYPEFVGQRQTDWVHPERVIEPDEAESYAEFVVDYMNQDRRIQRQSIATQLAE